MTDHAATTGAAQPAAPPPSPRPEKGPSLGLIALFVIVLALGLAAGVVLAPRLSPAPVPHAAQTTDHAHDDAPSEGGSNYYTCGMHPWVILPEPGICPICRMDLTPLDPNKFSGEVAIDPVIAQSIGVRVAPVVSGPVTRTIRTVGTVTYDETRVRDVNIKVEGWIEHLHVDYEGAEVRAGEPLFDLYSPRLYAAQEEYLAAVRSRERAVRLDNPAGASEFDALIDDAHTQLLFFDVQPQQIEELVERGAASKTIEILSPHTGVMIAKRANEGMRVEPGMRVYQVADLSKVWVMVSLYEYQTPFVQVGQQAEMTLPYIPGQRFEGSVIYAYPYLNESTRQLKVRLEFDNSAGTLKPGMYANVELRTTLARERTLAPRSAVIDTGERQVAFVSLGDGRFEPRDVHVGVETDGGMIEILDGLREGELVVTSGQFLLDSEARIRDSLAKMIRGELATEQAPPMASDGTELASLSPEVDRELSTLARAYFDIGSRLASDTMESIADDARTIASSVDALLATPVPGDEHFWHRHDEVATIRGEALALLDTPDIAGARLHFANMSIAFSKLLLATGVPASVQEPVEQLHCPMYREGQGGGLWLQRSGAVRNPFFGAVMLECFDARQTMPRAGAAPSEAPAAPAPSEDHSGHGGPTGAAAGAQADLDALFAAYLRMQDDLTRSDETNLDAQRTQMREIAARLADATDFVAPSLAMQVQSATSASATSIEEWRAAFGDLSDAMIGLARQAPPTEAGASALRLTYCPMVKKSWLQPGDLVANPYDPRMLRCGTIQETLPLASGVGAP